VVALKLQYKDLFRIQCLWDAPDDSTTTQPQWVAQPVYLDQRPSIDIGTVIKSYVSRKKRIQSYSCNKQNNNQVVIVVAESSWGLSKCTNNGTVLLSQLPLQLRRSTANGDNTKCDVQQQPAGWIKQRCSSRLPRLSTNSGDGLSPEFA
jgi:hypothetical protein